MKLLHFIQNSIVFLLCICILGFFANWAQNDYGMKLVMFSLLFLGILLACFSILQIQHQKIIKTLFTFCFIFLFLLPFLVHLNFQVNIILIIASIFLLLLTLFLPFALFIFDKKSQEKTNWGSFYPAIFVALFCLGNSLKLLHMPGASVVLVSSSFIIFPYYTFAFRRIIRSFQIRSNTEFFLGILHLFIGTNILAYCFKIQHWPYGNSIAAATILMLLLLVIITIVLAFKKQYLQNAWFTLPWVKRLIFVCFTITSIHYFLRITDITPALYSNEYPAALQDLWSNANNITKEGRENAKKAEIYNDNYLNFITKREEEAQKIKGD